MTDLVARLLLDLGRLGYGEAVEFDYVDDPVVRAIEEAYAPYAHGHLRVEADFGDACSGTAYFEDDASAWVRVELELEDRSVVTTPADLRGVPGHDRWHVQLLIDPARDRVVEMHLERIAV